MPRPELKYSSKFHPPWARSLCRRGLTLPEIAAEFGIARSTLCAWKKRYPEFSEAMEAGKGTADAQVENSLFQKSLGYNAAVKKTFKLRTVRYNEETGKKIEEREELVEGVDEVHVAADTTAMIFWLKNRCPDTWRDVQRMEHGGKVEVSHDPQIERLIEDPEAQRLLAELHARATSGYVEGSGEA